MNLGVAVRQGQGGATGPRSATGRVSQTGRGYHARSRGISSRHALVEALVHVVGVMAEGRELLPDHPAGVCFRVVREELATLGHDTDDVHESFD